MHNKQQCRHSYRNRCNKWSSIKVNIKHNHLCKTLILISSRMVSRWFRRIRNTDTCNSLRHTWIQWGDSRWVRRERTVCQGRIRYIIIICLLSRHMMKERSLNGSKRGDHRQNLKKNKNLLTSSSINHGKKNSSGKFKGCPKRKKIRKKILNQRKRKKGKNHKEWLNNRLKQYRKRLNLRYSKFHKKGHLWHNLKKLWEKRYSRRKWSPSKRWIW